MTDYKKLCAELHAALDKHDLSLAEDELLDRSAAALRAALAEAEPEWPTDEEIEEWIDVCPEIPLMGLDFVHGWSLCFTAEMFRDTIRAALAHWGNRSAPQPVPVSERLPGPEDCDAEGRCWLGGERFAPGDPTWILGFPAWARRFPGIHRYWLPANALPLPS